MGESGTERVRLLEADRELAACVGADDLECAQQTTVADIVRLERGVQDPSGVGSHHLLGLLVLDGLMISVLEVAQRRGYELIGPGVLLRPWDHSDDTAPTPCVLRWKVLEPVTVARLDERVTRACARWPARG
ncbi:MAG TPA: hypothetical protein VFN87_22715 [Solirubrobacteraceae bacterium]|nr:hypothetical protein [Solirubrobacteraceae bacterium]